MRAYVFVLQKNVVKFLFKIPVTFLFVKWLKRCLYSKINGNGNFKKYKNVHPQVYRICLFCIYLTIYLSFYLYICLSIYLSSSRTIMLLAIYLHMNLSIHLSIYIPPAPSCCWQSWRREQRPAGWRRCSRSTHPAPRRIDR